MPVPTPAHPNPPLSQIPSAPPVSYPKDQHASDHHTSEPGHRTIPPTLNTNRSNLPRNSSLSAHTLVPSIRRRFSATSSADNKKNMNSLWDLVRAFVSRKFFSSFMNGASASSGNEFTVHMHKTWISLCFQQAQFLNRNSTLAFHPVSSNDQPDLHGLNPPSGSVSISELKPNISDVLAGMSLAKLSSFKFTHTMALILSGFQDIVSTTNKPTNPLLITMQHFLTAWKILTLALQMPDPVHRRLALDTLAAVCPAISRTCLDLDMRSLLGMYLLDVMVGDEFLINRMHAIHVLGDTFGLYLRLSDESHLDFDTFPPTLGKDQPCTTRVFFALSYALHSRLNADRALPPIVDSRDETFLASTVSKIFLFTALGKFIHAGLEPEWVKPTILYLIWVEFHYMFPNLIHIEDYMGVLVVIMRILTSIPQTKSNQKFMGALFKPFIQPLMLLTSTNIPNSPRVLQKSPHPLSHEHINALQRLAVQFTSLWLPITNDSAYSHALLVLIDGLKAFPTDDHAVIHDRSYLLHQIQLESSKSTTRNRVLWQLLQMPGMSCRLQRVPGAPKGWFANPDETPIVDDTITDQPSAVPLCNMPLTTRIAILLPDSSDGQHALHSDTIVYVTRPLPQLPGVPDYATTVPPVFMDPSWVLKVKSDPGSMYEVHERTGRVPCLPPGYTYSPVQFPLPTVTKPPPGKSFIPPKCPTDSHCFVIQPGEVSSAIPPLRRVPYGFITRPDLNESPAGSSPVSAHSEQLTVIQRPSAGLLTSKAIIEINDTDLGAFALNDRLASNPIVEEPPFLQNRLLLDGNVSPKVKPSILNTRMEDGYTYEPLPSVFQAAPATLVDTPPVSEFLLHAPVVLDIVEPNRARRVTARIISIDKDFEPIAVNNAGYFCPGARFNIHIQPRKIRRHGASIAVRGGIRPPSATINSLKNYQQTINSHETVRFASLDQIDLDQGPQHTLTGQDDVKREMEGDPEWITIQLQVEEDAGPSVEVLHSANKGLSSSSVVACGYTQDGTPYFAPPVNPSPLPCGYTTDGEAYYGMPAELKPVPSGVLTNAQRFYATGTSSANWDTTLTTQHALAGFDYCGLPFFVPRGTKIPTPSGYTSYGLPYYNLSAILLERGQLLETAFQLPKTHLSWTSALCFIKAQQVPSWMNNTSSSAESTLGDPAWFHDPSYQYTEPHGIQVIQGLEDLMHLRAPSIKTVLEPSSLHFQSISTVVTRPCILKFRALRGDYSEHNYFFSVEPMDVFTIDQFDVRLQGEGVVQVRVSCHSSRIKFQTVEGALSLIDKTGRQLSTCKLIGSRMSIVLISPLRIHCGWVIPNESTTLQFSCENMSSQAIQLSLKGPTNRFHLADNAIKLQGRESKNVSVVFEPCAVGAYESEVQVEAPGGEVVTVHLAGVCGIPLALHVESSKDSLMGPDLLARERSVFISRVFGVMSSGESILNVAEKHLHSFSDRELFSSLLNAMDPVGRRRDPVCLDFGLVDNVNEGPAEGAPTGSLCLTLFNVSKETLTCALHTTSSELSLDSVVRITPHKANSLQVLIRPKNRGPFCSMVTLTCPGFTPITCLVHAFVGCPILLASMPTVWMPPVEPGGLTVDNIPVINQWSQAVDAHIEITSTNGCIRLRGAEMKLKGQALPPIQAQDNRSTESQRTMASILTIPPYSITSLSLECIQFEGNWETASVSVTVHDTLLTGPITILALPLWTNLVQQDFESIIYWLQQCAQLAPLPPTTGPPTLINNVPREPLSSHMPPQLKITSKKLVTARKLTLQPNSSESLQFQILLSPAFVLVKQSSSRIRTNPNESAQMQISLRTEYLLENHGFIAVYPDGMRGLTVPIISSPLITVCPTPTLPAREIVVDFGAIEAGTQRSEEWCVRTVLLANTRETNVLWTCRMLSNQNRHCPFEVLTQVNELSSMKCDLIKIDINPTVQGTFEAVCELMAKENTSSLPALVCQISLRVSVISTQVFGLPELLDFGSCVVSSVQSNEFELENIGNCKAHIALIPRFPYHVFPSSCVLDVSARQTFRVTYSPIESSKDHTGRIACFINHKMFTLPVLGRSGFVDLVSNNHHNILDFGSVSSTSIAWMTVYLTNRGTLPLRLEHVLSKRPDVLSIELLGKQLIVRSSNVSINRDGWAILKRKIKILVLMSHFVRKKMTAVFSQAVSGTKGHRTKAPANESKSNRHAPNDDVNRRVRIPVTPAAKLTLLEMIGNEDQLILEPLHSFVCRIGFSTTLQKQQSTDLSFLYTAIISTQDNIRLKQLDFTVTGTIYRVLDFAPYQMDFGLIPVSVSAASLSRVLAASVPQDSGFLEQVGASTVGSNTRILRVSNMSVESQSVSLLLSSNTNTSMSLSGSNLANTSTTSTPTSVGISAFRFDGRSWAIGPGESVRVPVRFLPTKPQTQYIGEALLQHSHGISIIRFSGTGASAEVIHSTKVSFGFVSINKKGYTKFSIRNKGLLATRVFCQMTDTSVFCFEGLDPFDAEFVLEAGTSLVLNLGCLCTEEIPSVISSMSVKWRRSPHEPPESSDVILAVDVGYPQFSVDLLELDFGVTYTINSTELTLTNGGNAPCNWRVQAAGALAFSPSSGYLASQSQSKIIVTFQPTSYDFLETNIEFFTDAGVRDVLAYGIVGVPYLRIMDEYLLYDFGIIQVNQDHSAEIPLQNTGPKQIEFMIEMIHPNLSEGETPVFTVFPMHGFISAMSTTNLTLVAQPVTFAKVSSCVWIIRTVDGEQYQGGISCVGGQAIVRLSKLLGTAEDSAELTSNENNGDSAQPKRHIQQSIFTLQNHVKALQEVTLNLSSGHAIEMEAQVRAVDQLRHVTSRSSLIASPNGSGIASKAGSSPSRPVTGVSSHTPENLRSASSILPTITARGSFSELDPLPLPPITGEAQTSSDIGIPSHRRSSKNSLAKQRWLEGKLFNLQDVLEPVQKLFAIGDDLVQRLQFSVPEEKRKSLNNPHQRAGSLKAIHGGNEQSKSPRSSSVGSRDSIVRPVTPGELQAFIEASKHTVEVLQMHIPHVNEAKHAYILEESVKLILESLQQFENVMYSNDDQTSNRTVKTFDLGLLRSGELVEDYLLFDLPNLGNLPFAFSTEISPRSMCSVYQVHPATGTILPGTSVPIQLRFSSIEEREYCAEIQISGNGRVAAVVAVIAKVGSPKIVVLAQSVSFGLLLRGTSESLELTLRNSGTYRDTVEFVLNSPVFSLALVSRTSMVLPGNEISVPIVFTPKAPGFYSGTLAVVPLSGVSITIPIDGEGGLPELTITPNKLIFGRIFVGGSKPLNVTLNNTGNWPATVLPRLTHSAFSLSLDGPILEPGDTFVIAPKSTISPCVTFSALDGKLDAMTTLLFEEACTKERVNVKITGSAGLFLWDVSGAVTFGNIRVGDLSTCEIAIFNSGDFSFEVFATIQPEEFIDMFTVTSSGITIIGSRNSRGLDPGTNTTISISVCPKVSQRMLGLINLNTVCNLDKLSQERVYPLPFDFFAFADPVIVENQNETVDIGLLAVGKTKEWTFNVTNFDNFPVIVRVRMDRVSLFNALSQGEVAGSSKTISSESKKGIKKKRGKLIAVKSDTRPVAKSCWTLSVPELLLNKGESGTLCATYNALDDPTASHEVAVWVEYSRAGEDSSDFKTIHRYVLQGKSGHPKVELDLSNIDFGFIPCGKPVSQTVHLQNTGTAPSDWVLQPGWANDDLFTVVDGNPVSGTVMPGESVKIMIQFDTLVTFEFTSEMVFVLDSSDDKKLSLLLRGQGSVYRIYTPALPKQVVIHGLIHGDQVQRYTITVANDCTLPVSLQFSTICSTRPDLNQLLAVDPPQITLLANHHSDVGSGERQSLTADIVLAPIRPATITEIAALISNGLEYVVSIKSPTLPDAFLILVQVLFTFKPIRCNIQSIDFGKTPYDVMKTYDKPIAISNDNSFAIPINVFSSHNQVKVSTTAFEILPNAIAEVAAQLNPLSYENEEEIPPSLLIAGSIDFFCETLHWKISVAVTGDFVDVMDPPELCDLDFGMVYTGTQVTQSFTFQNWTRRSLDYQLIPAPDSSADFHLPVDITSKKTVPGRQHVSIPITFSPSCAASLSVPITLVTSSGAFSISLVGQGIRPAVIPNSYTMEFGKVGVGYAVSRNVSLTNSEQRTVVIELSVESSVPHDATFFRVPKTLHLEPGKETPVMVEFYPQEQRTAASAMLMMHAFGQAVSEPVLLKAETGMFDVRVKGGTRSIQFPAVEVMDMSRCSVEFENVGEISAELAICMNDKHVLLKSGCDIMGKESVASFGCKPVSQTIAPGFSGKFTLTATGLREGKDKCTLLFITSNLSIPSTYALEAEATVISPQNSSGLKAFAKADASIDEKLSVDARERQLHRSDENLWMILLPVVKIDSVAADAAGFTPVPPIEPMLHYPSIVHQITRPAALPPTLGQGNAKHTAARKVRLSRVETVVDPAVELVPKMMARYQQRHEALAILSPLERKVALSQAGNRNPGGKGLDTKKYR